MVTKQTVNSFNKKYYIFFLTLNNVFLLFTKNFFLTLYKCILQKSWVSKKGFLRKMKESLKNHGCLVIKEIFKKQGILKPGNFFQKHINFLKTQLFKHLKKL